MLYFNSDNTLFAVNESFNQDLFYLKASRTTLLPFQFRKLSGSDMPLYGWGVRNYQTGEITTFSNSLITKISAGSGIYFFLYVGGSLGVTLDCGIYQVILRLQLSKGAPYTSYYSNYFVVSDNDNYITLGSNLDFGKKLLTYPYPGGFAQKIFFNKLALTNEPYFEENIIESGSVNRERESQVWSEIYKLSIIVDKWTLKELSQISMYDICTLTFDEYLNEFILDRIEFSQNYNEDLRLYEVELTFKVNEINKVCGDDIDLKDFIPATAQYVILNDNGDRLIGNNSGDYIISNS